MEEGRGRRQRQVRGWGRGTCTDGGGAVMPTACGTGSREKRAGRTTSSARACAATPEYGTHTFSCATRLPQLPDGLLHPRIHPRMAPAAPRIASAPGAAGHLMRVQQCHIDGLGARWRHSFHFPSHKA